MVGCTKVFWLSLPKSSGSFQSHLQKVENSLKGRLKEQNNVEFSEWSPEAHNSDLETPLLILFQSQGRPGDEFPSVVPRKIRGSALQVVVVVIQDDEYSSAQRTIVPEDVTVRGIISVHVIPGQHVLHQSTKNQKAVATIAELLLLERGTYMKRLMEKVPDMLPNRRLTVSLLLLPKSTGDFYSRMQKIGDSVKRELETSYKVQLQPWVPGQQDSNSHVLVVFCSQGRPGDDFPSAIPAELKGAQQKVLVAVVQDDEWTSCSRTIVPEDINLVSVVNLHVVPGQSTLHAPGSSLSPRNKETISTIARDLNLQPRSCSLWPYALASLCVVAAITIIERRLRRLRLS